MDWWCEWECFWSQLSVEESVRVSLEMDGSRPGGRIHTQMASHLLSIFIKMAKQTKQPGTILRWMELTRVLTVVAGLGKMVQLQWRGHVLCRHWCPPGVGVEQQQGLVVPLDAT